MLPHYRPGNLADIDIAARIDGYPMRRNELTGRFAGFSIAEPSQAVACFIIDIDPVTEIGRVLIYRVSRPQLADIANRILASAVHVQSARTMHVVPLGFVLAVGVKYLNPIIFPIGDVYPAVSIRADIMDDVELAWIGPRLSPGEQQFPIGRIFVNARVAVTVGNVDLFHGRERDMGAANERLAALVRRGFTRNTEGKESLAIQGALAHGVITVIG